MTPAKYEIRSLNSATKYPIIPTYHKIGKDKKLQQDCIIFNEPVIVTEKLDGSNGRIVFMPYGHYYIGSREELILSSSSVLFSDKTLDITCQNIVNILKPIADRLRERFNTSDPGYLLVLYFEVFGYKCSARGKQYSGNSTAVSCRLFDSCSVPVEMLGKTLSHISSWWEHGGQEFASWGVLLELASDWELITVPTLSKDWIPTKLIRATYLSLKQFIRETSCRIHITALGRPEGIIIRTPDRSQIAKIRYEDYGRTLGFDPYVNLDHDLVEGGN
ncbi:RNA ligase [Nodularia phage vB_NspS-kac65v162]|jgi:hypothetical protein|uniref:RNA ligase n=2 Tax=Ravarandavirus kac65v151 TaxID=2845689 RepID=A0A482MH76_9CAUD|nr:RNA ligase [Nodularia phage vB_NspS-kac65v161]QBQ73497.1 RNA ligase [Nodularia phage vB_NspS-kac65v162]